MKINWFKLIFYLSLIFLIIKLYQGNYLVIPDVISISYLVLSLLFLFIGMLTTANNWKDILNHVHKIDITYRDAIISNGLTVFAKYIPGKILVIVGRSLYISEKYTIDKGKCTYASIQTQLFTLLVGFIFGSIILYYIENTTYYVIGVLSMILILSALLFSYQFWKVFHKFLEKIFKRDFELTVIPSNLISRISISFIVNWLLWSLAFYFFVSALSLESVNVILGFTFPFAATFAIIAFFAPGGLGVREGLISMSLILCGLNEVSALSIAVSSRLWFLIGEVFLFFIALYLKSYESKKNN